MNRRTYILTGSAVVGLMVLIYTAGSRKALSPAGDAAASGNSPALADQIPSTQPGDSLLPQEYAFLQTQSPFGSGRGAAAHGGPEAAFIFRGAVQTGSSITAFIENANTKDVVQMAIGASLARGRIKTIDLDAIEYEALGNSKRIEVGHNLNGEVVEPPPTTAPSGPPATNAPPGPDQNGNAPPNAQSPPMPPRKQG